MWQTIKVHFWKWQFFSEFDGTKNWIPSCIIFSSNTCCLEQFGNISKYRFCTLWKKKLPFSLYRVKNVILHSKFEMDIEMIIIWLLMRDRAFHIDQSESIFVCTSGQNSICRSSCNITVILKIVYCCQILEWFLMGKVWNNKSIFKS